MPLPTGGGEIVAWITLIWCSITIPEYRRFMVAVDAGGASKIAVRVYRRFCTMFTEAGEFPPFYRADDAGGSHLWPCRLGVSTLSDWPRQCGWCAGCTTLHDLLRAGVMRFMLRRFIYERFRAFRSSLSSANVRKNWRPANSGSNFLDFSTTAFLVGVI